MTEVLHEMLKGYGLKEITGEENNPAIIEMFHSIGFTWVKEEETAWCSAALNYFCFRLGYERSGKLNARSWLQVGEEIETPQLGDVVVFWRISPQTWQGHVGLYITGDEDTLWICGGNQSDMLCIAPYPRSRVLGYRRLRKVVYFKGRRGTPLTKKVELPPIKINIISLWRLYRKIKKFFKHKN